MRRPAMLAAALLAAGFAVVAPARAAATFTSTMVNSSSGQCATVPHGDSAVQLTQTACTSGAGQSYTFTPASGDAYTIGTFTSGSCVDIYGASTSDNAAVIQYACHGETNQQFRLQSVGTNTFNVVAFSSGKCFTPANNALVQLPCSSASAWRVPGYTPGTSDTYQGIPNLAPNACKNSGLPRSYGTNFQTPNDPYGQGFQNTTAIGWDGNYWPVFSYLSGSFFARGVNTTYNGLCGGLYSFGAYTYGGNPGAQSVQWTEDNGYLPAMTTSRTSGTVGITIKNFADRVTITDNAF